MPNSASASGEGKPPSTDDLLPLGILATLRARPKRLPSSLRRIEFYVGDHRMRGEAGFLLTQLSAAAAFLASCDASQLKGVDEEVLRGLKAAKLDGKLVQRLQAKSGKGILEAAKGIVGANNHVDMVEKVLQSLNIENKNEIHKLRLEDALDEICQDIENYDEASREKEREDNILSDKLKAVRFALFSNQLVGVVL